MQKIGPKKTRRVISIILPALVAVVLLVLYGAYCLQRFRTSVQDYIVAEIVSLQQELDLDVPDIYLIAHSQSQPVRFGLLPLWETGYFAGWRYDHGTLTRLGKEDWWAEADKDLTTLAIFSIRQLGGPRLYVPVDFVLPKRFSLDRETNPVSGTLWILDYSKSEWQFKRELWEDDRNPLSHPSQSGNLAANTRCT
jgi:hypothetical protein